MKETKEVHGQDNNQEDVCLKLETNLAKMLVKALESPAIIESVSLAEKSKDRKERITVELKQFQEKKIALENEIETLKDEFGSVDSVKDLEDLKKLNIELDSLRTAIPIMEKHINESILMYTGL